MIDQIGIYYLHNDNSMLPWYILTIYVLYLAHIGSGDTRIQYRNIGFRGWCADRFL